MKAARGLLLRLTELLPPPEGVNHALVINAGKLTVVLFHGGAWESYIVEEADLDKGVDVLVTELVALREQRKT
jgi:hypothetical protein